MANQIQTPDAWPLDVRQIAQTDPVLGGPEGPVNLMGAALATRGFYQRLRNITPWDAALGAYPSGACVMYAGVSWRSKAAGNTAVPGTDAAKWERWAYSESELAATMGRAWVRFQGAVPPTITVPSVAVPNTGVYARLLLPNQIHADPDFVVSVANNTITLLKAGLYMITSDCAGNSVDSTRLINSQTILRVNGVGDNLNRGVHVQGAGGYLQWSNSIKGEVWIPAGSVIDICGWNTPGGSATTQFIYDLMITRAVTNF